MELKVDWFMGLVIVGFVLSPFVQLVAIEFVEGHFQRSELIDFVFLQNGRRLISTGVGMTGDHVVRKNWITTIDEEERRFIERSTDADPVDHQTFVQEFVPVGVVRVDLSGHSV